MTQTFTETAGWTLLAAFWLASCLAVWLGLRRRDTRSKEGFLAAGRNMGWIRTSFSIAATWIWAPALFVAAQQGYQHGWVGVFWFTVPNVACLALFAWFAQRARTLFPKGYTLSAATRTMYSTRVQRLYIAAFTILAVCSFAVQLLAGGLVVAALTGIDYTAVTIALATIALSYSLWSGLGSSIISDWMQMGLIGAVAIVISVAVAVKAGAATMTAGLAGIGGDYLHLWEGPGAALFWSFGLSTTIGLMSGPFGDQSFWQRAWAVDERHVKRSFLLGAAIFAIVPLGMSLLGFAAAGAGLQPADPQLTNLAAILHWLPAWVAIPFLLYIFSGLVSTLSSMLCSVASMAGHDLTSADAPHHYLRNARLGMAALAIGGVAIANLPGIAIVQLFIFYGTVRAATMLPTVGMLTWQRRLSEAGAFWGILAALAVGLPLSAYGNLTKSTPHIVAGSLAVLLLSGAGVAVGTWLEDVKDRRDRARLAAATDSTPASIR